MNSHGPNKAVNGNGGNGLRKELLIGQWTIAQFRQAVYRFGYDGFQPVYWGNSPQCCFPRCPTRAVNLDRPFEDDEEVRLWLECRSGDGNIIFWMEENEKISFREACLQKNARIIPCCAWHRWNDSSGDVSRVLIMRRESDMIPVFAQAMGFNLMRRKQNQTPPDNGAREVIASFHTQLVVA